VFENLLELGGRFLALSGGQVCLPAYIHVIRAGNIGDEGNVSELDGRSSGGRVTNFGAVDQA
jgi:hypothetical protein